ncbi:restriction endonuclease subunit S [Mycoplasma sp. P36-A1]|uniref:restriction endonuclease subunit S n=1 Tax=Mycoplasma sp. P36-A1 TaxID=3252900 RepID=UPI003C301001
MKLSEVCEFQNGYAFKSKDFVENGDYKVIKIKELKNGLTQFFNDSASIETISSNQEKYVVHKDDVLFALTGDPVSKSNPLTWVGRVSRYQFDEPALLNQRVCKIIPYEDQVDKDYLYYFFREFSNFYDLAQRATGSASQVNISTKQIGEVEIDLPSLDEQKKISITLRSLDEKIENNKKINHHLAEMAQSIFTSWFIDYEPFGGVKPSNWTNGKLSDILMQVKNTIKSGEEPDLPYVPIDELPMNSLGLNTFRPNDEAKSSLITFDKNDILIGAMRVYFHRVCVAPFRGITRSTCFVLRPTYAEYLEFALLICNQNSSINFANSTSKGSTMPYAVWENGLADLSIDIPPMDVISDFSKIVNPMIEKIRDSLFEQHQLKATRDTLLPKLMTGEITVTDEETKWWFTTKIKGRKLWSIKVVTTEI